MIRQKKAISWILKSIIRLFILWLIWVIGSYFWNMAFCIHDVLLIVPSPGNMDASVNSEMCYSEYIYVELKDKTLNDKKMVLHYAAGSDSVILKWIYANNLEVRIPEIESDEIGLETIRWRNINITYHFWEK